MFALLSVVVSTSVAQCATGINDNAQTLCGLKTFPNGVILGRNEGDYESATVRGSGVLLDGPYAGLQRFDGRAMYLRDSVPAGSSSPSFFIQTYNARNATDEVLRITNGSSPGVPILILYGDGTISTGTIRTNGHSGDPSLQASQNYVGLSAGFPAHYQGEHGAVSISPGNACENEAFNLLQASNAASGTGARTDYVFNITCMGGRYSRKHLKSWQLPICNNALPEPPEPNNRYGNCTGVVNGGLQGNFGIYGPLVDGGYCYDWTTYYGPDGGYAKHGTVFDFVDDVGEGCICRTDQYDGGPSPAGWFRQSDRQECRP